MSEPIEYPKALYLGGTAEGDFTIAADADAEAALRAEGYAPIDEAAARTPSKRRREA